MWRQCGFRRTEPNFLTPGVTRESWSFAGKTYFSRNEKIFPRRIIPCPFISPYFTSEDFFSSPSANKNFPNSRHARAISRRGFTPRLFQWKRVNSAAKGKRRTLQRTLFNAFLGRERGSRLLEGRQTMRSPVCLKARQMQLVRTGAAIFRKKDWL